MPLFDVYPLNPITIKRGLGSWVYDENNAPYLDMYGGHAVISIGHSHPKWVKAIQTQVEQLAFYSNSVVMPIQDALAGKLEQVSGKSGYQLFLCNSGAEANENALKLASFQTGRKRIIAFKGAFHGRTSLAVAATDNVGIQAAVNQGHDIEFLPFNDVQALVDAMKRYGNEVAAIIVEGIQGVGGIRVASNEFLQCIRSVSEAYGAVYVADGVQCGYGRTGHFFSHDFAGVNADIYSMAKGMGNGFPIGGILISPHIKPKHGMLGTTFGGNPLACAAALAVLNAMEDEHLMQQAETTGKFISNAIKEIPELHHLRGRGLMIGFDVDESIAGLRKHLLEHENVFTGEAKPNVIRLLPALNLGQDLAETFISRLKNGINQLSHGG